MPIVLNMVSGLLLAVSTVFALVHLLLGIRFVQRVSNYRGRSLSDDECPPALVVLCIRGADPFLERCLQSLFRQNYPRYEVRIVVDSTDDPGWGMVHELIGRMGVNHVSVRALTDRRPNCSLKCSSQLQALQNLQPQHELIAFLDADTVPHPSWIRELAAALQDPQVGAATGGRWYLPSSPSPGAIVRLLWNMPAQVIMALVNIAWGGTLAFRRETFDRLRIVDRWGGALCEDTMTADVLREHGLKMKFVPSLLMINREDSSFRSVCYWISRQLINTRLYHSFWWFVIAHGSTIFLIVYGGALLAGVAAALGDATAARRALLAVVVLQAALLSLFVWLQFWVNKVLRRRGEEANWGSVVVWLTIPFWVVIAQAVNFWALLRAQFSRTVEWRGIIYKIQSPFAIQIVEESQITATRTHSL